MKKLVISLIAITVAFVIITIVIGRTFYPDNVAETSPDGGSKGLKTRYYDMDSAKVRDASKDVIGKLTTWGGAWRIVDQTDGGSEQSIRVEIPVVIFTDDLEVKIKDEAGRSRVDVRSASRVGKSDFGENERHVRQFLSALDRAVRSDP